MGNGKVHDENGWIPKCLGSHALAYAAWINNRMYNKAVSGIPYDKFMGVKPDLHYARTFGSKAYVYVSKGSTKPREHDNAKIGYVLGLDDEHVGYKMYFPEERTCKWVDELSIDEQSLYNDRHTNADRPPDPDDWFVL